MDSCDNEDENDIIEENETEEDITTNVRKANSFRGGMDST